MPAGAGSVTNGGEACGAECGGGLTACGGVQAPFLRPPSLLLAGPCRIVIQWQAVWPSGALVPGCADDAPGDRCGVDGK